MAGCIPWDYPTIMKMSDTKICTGGVWESRRVFEEGPLEVFEKYMQYDSALKHCNCEPNCEEVAYHVEVKSLVISRDPPNLN